MKVENPKERSAVASKPRFRSTFGLAKLLGSALGRYTLRRDLLILCYHGISTSDEHCFKPSMFMRTKTFARRMALLQSGGWPVLPLEIALQQLKQGTLPPGAIAITFDDGWKKTIDVAESVLSPAGLPATVYVTTHYVKKTPAGIKHDAFISLVAW